MQPDTHLAIRSHLVGSPVAMSAGFAAVELTTTDEMVADAQGLVHGGFVFGAVDYAAMLAVNDPNVVLGSADVRFTAPVRVGDVVRCEARTAGTPGRKQVVTVSASVDGVTVVSGTLTAFILDSHVLSGRT